MKQNRPEQFFIQEHLQTAEVQHGGVGCKDIERTLLKKGFQPIQIPYHFEFSMKAKAFRLFFIIVTVCSLKRKAIVVFQWPLYGKLNRLLISLIQTFRRDIRLICIITDIEGLRDGDKKLLSLEIRFFKKIKFFVVHNEAMKAWLLRFHSAAKISLLDFFDFLIEIPRIQRYKNDSVVFAGFLDKSRFVRKLHRVGNLKIDLYGLTSKPLKANKDMHYRGVISNEQLLQDLNSSFGLIWDGDSLETLNGTYGNYNRLNSPHKLSLYTVAGIPSIAHYLSGAASIIHKYGIGFTVSSLFEIKEKISHLTEDDYQKMRNNCALLAGRITSGKCLIEALSNLGLNGMHFND